MREAEKVERLRLAQTPTRPTIGREPAELDQSRLVRVQFQGELREPLAQVPEKPLGVLLMLEPDDEVVGEADDDHVTVRAPPPPPLGPQVEDVVQIHVGEQRRYRCSLR